MLTQVGWRGGSPPEGSDRLLALKTCMSQQRGERLEDSGQGERSMITRDVVALNCLSAHVFKLNGKGKWKLWIKKEKKKLKEAGRSEEFKC